MVKKALRALAFKLLGLKSLHFGRAVTDLVICFRTWCREVKLTLSKYWVCWLRNSPGTDDSSLPYECIQMSSFSKLFNFLLCRIAEILSSVSSSSFKKKNWKVLNSCRFFLSDSIVYTFSLSPAFSFYITFVGQFQGNISRWRRLAFMIFSLTLHESSCVKVIGTLVRWKIMWNPLTYFPGESKLS